MKKKALLALALCLALLLCACGGQESAPAAENGENAQKKDGVVISLNGDSAEVRGGGAMAIGSVVTIGAVGEYRISGTLNDGQIVVDTGESPVNVTLILDGVDITNKSGPAILVRQAKNVRLVLNAAQNSLTSGVEADLGSYDESRSGAAIYSEDDLKIEGGGRLNVYGYLNNGIACKDDVKIESGDIAIVAANNGLRASESITVTGGSLAVRSGNDGLKTSSDSKEGKGFIEISGGSVSVASAGDAISAVTELRVSGGTVHTETRQDLVGEGSRKGLKAGTFIDLSGASLDIQADEDGVRCDGDVLVSGGELRIVATTGIQSGAKGSGAGDIRLTGGKLVISAAKQALKAEGSIHLDCDLLAFCGSDKQAAPAAGSRSYLLGTVEGRAGEVVLFGFSEETFTAPQSFKVLLCSASALESGRQYEVLVGGERSYALTAR